MGSEPGLAPATGARLRRGAVAPTAHSWPTAAAVPATRLVCGYLACDARLAGMLLAGLPPLVRVNVRGSNAGVWLEASVRYALAEARSPRPGGAGVLAKLAEVLFIEVLRLHMNEQGAGRTGWLAGVGDRIVGAALNALHQPPRAGLDAGRTGTHGAHLALGAGRALPAAGGQLADAVPDAVAHAAGRQPACAAATRRWRASPRTWATRPTPPSAGPSGASTARRPRRGGDGKGLACRRFEPTGSGWPNAFRCGRQRDVRCGLFKALIAARRRRFKSSARCPIERQLPGVEFEAVSVD